MKIHRITPDFAVSGQCAPEDFSKIAAWGFTTLLCNRPDRENPVTLQASRLRAPAETAGLRFEMLPIIPGSLPPGHITDLQRLRQESAGPILAYCASGMRSALLWALSEAGSRPTDHILRDTAAVGFVLESLRPQLDALSG